LSHTGEDEEDLTQDIAIIVWQWARRERIDDPFAFACMVKRNLLGRRLTRRLATAVAATETIRAAIESEPEEHVGEREEIRDLDELLSERLGWLERRVLELRERGFAREEIATQVRVPLPEVRVIAQRARRKLAPALKLLGEHGRCGMLALTIADIASGRIGRSDPRWLIGQKHLERCGACRRTVNASRRAARFDRDVPSGFTTR